MMILSVLLACQNDTIDYASVEAEPQRISPIQHQKILQDLFPELHLLDEDAVNLHVEMLPESTGFQYTSHASKLPPSESQVDNLVALSLEVADRVVEQNPKLISCFEDNSCWKSWVVQLAQRAWRRHLNAEEIADLYSSTTEWLNAFAIEEAVAMTIAGILMSPDFYFIGLKEDPNYHVAEKLSFLLWNSLPSPELLNKAAKGELQRSTDIEATVYDMLEDPKAYSGIYTFHYQWLDFEQLSTATIDLKHFFSEMYELYGEERTAMYYTKDIKYSFAVEAEFFFGYNALHGDHNLKNLLTSRTSFVNYTLEDIYNIEAEGPLFEYPYIYGSDLHPEFFHFRKVTLPENRKGFLTLPAVMHMTSLPMYPSPVRRGLLVGHALLCYPIMTPPADIPPLEAVEEDDPQTNRERFAMHTTDPSCNGCHQAMDGIGFGFEHYDVLGRWQDTDNGYEIDSSGKLGSYPFNDAIEMIDLLAKSQQSHQCYTEHWLSYALGREPHEEEVGHLSKNFWQSNGDIPTLIADIATHPNFLEMK